MILPDSTEININFELLTPQTHENITIIPIKTEIKSKLDILTLKKGMKLGLVEVKELKESTVNTLTVKNKAVTPLLLIDGEELVGGDQNRIVNTTTLIPAKNETKISVSCTERGRWKYKNEFKSSPNIANYKTRSTKEHARYSKQPIQDQIWSSIDTLESNLCFKSPTSSMSESYENQKTNLNNMMKSFSIANEQNGILIMINGEIKGFEILLNPEIYKDFHEKIIKSYLIDTEIKTSIFTINIDVAKNMIQNAIDSIFVNKESSGLEQSYEFENGEGLGTLHIYKNEIIHWSYFKKEIENIIKDDFAENNETESNTLKF